MCKYDVILNKTINNLGAFCCFLVKIVLGTACCCSAAAAVKLFLHGVKSTLPTMMQLLEACSRAAQYSQPKRLQKSEAIRVANEMQPG